MWTQSLPNAPQGLALAREKGWLLAWDDHHWLYLLNQGGERQGQARLDGLTTACCAEDGSAYAAAGSRGEVWWLSPDLMRRWERALPQGALASALDPFGQYLAVSDTRGGLHIFDRQGRSVCQAQTARPLHHLAFVPAAPYLVGSSDYGLVACYDLNGSLAWQDGLVAHIGSLAVSGDGRRLLLACFSEGLQLYGLGGQNLGRQSLPEPCRLAALTYDGRVTLAATLTNRLLVLDGAGQVHGTHVLEGTITALALAALGDRVLVALAEGSLACLGVGMEGAER